MALWKFEHFEKNQKEIFSANTVQLEGFFNFPPIPVGNKTEWKGLKFLTPLGGPTHFGGNTAMKI